MSASKRWFKIILPLLIVAFGIFGMRLMVLSRTAPSKAVRENPGLLVETMKATRRDHPVRVHGTGTVQPRQEADITPQVSGRVVEISPRLVAGGFFEKGDLLFAIEAIDYRLAVDRAQAALARAEVDLATVESQARIARGEWERLNLDDGEEPNPLVLYEPQLKNARAGVASARASLAQAELDLKRTRVVAPFNCLIRSEQIDFGQYLRAGTSVAVVAGSDNAEVLVPLPMEELRWLRIPGPGEAEGSPATACFRCGDDTFEWQGRIVRSLGEVDSRGRMSRVVVAVEDPFGLRRSAKKERPRLELGMFVEVALHGETLREAISLPRKALRDDDTVWLADAENLLRIVPVDVLRQEKDEVLIGGGLPEDARLVLTSLSGAAEGMKLRPLAEGEGR
jgi:RND family efflux transporter MFP subunit